MCKTVLCDNDIAPADALLLRYCMVTPNMHMHDHLNVFQIMEHYPPFDYFPSSDIL